MLNLGMSHPLSNRLWMGIIVALAAKLGARIAGYHVSLWVDLLIVVAMVGILVFDRRTRRRAEQGMNMGEPTS